MKKHIAVLAGDGIGPEITDGAIAVLKKIGEKYGHEFEFEHLLMGVCAIEETGEPLPQYTIDRCLLSDSVLLGAVGGAVGHNPISILIPCHRCVGADGSLTGYAGGVEKKRFLLTLEGADLSHLYVPKHGTVL